MGIIFKLRPYTSPFFAVGTWTAIDNVIMKASCSEEEPHSSSDRCNASPPKKKVKKWYFQPFNWEWLMDPELKEWLISDPKDKYVAMCKVCDTKFRNSNKTALLVHKESQKHQKNFSAKKSTIAINTFRSPKEPDPQDKVSKAELLLTAFMAEHQVPFRQADHLVETIKKMFPYQGMTDIAELVGTSWALFA